MTCRGEALNAFFCITDTNEPAQTLMMQRLAARPVILEQCSLEWYAQGRVLADMFNDHSWNGRQWQKVAKALQ